MENEKIIINQLIGQWQKDVAAMTKIFETLGASNAGTEVAAGRNTVAYLLGHMVAVHDRLMEALDAGERTCAQLDQQFLLDEDTKTGYPPYDELLEKWKKVNENVSAVFTKQTVADWLSKHHYVSEADFKNEPHRNRLAILISRYGHLNTHLGQLKLIK